VLVSPSPKNAKQLFLDENCEGVELSFLAINVIFPEGCVNV
jgi:hypothetical protein